MYLEFYGLIDPPFAITPNPRFLFLSKHHREVFAHLLFGIRRHAGFIEVTGEVGTGKTTVLRTLFLELEKEGARIAYIFNPTLTPPELLRTVNREFGLAEDGSATELHARLNAFLLQENGAGRTVVLVIDEAQNLAVELLEQVRLLSNLETDTDKLIQIVLVGQPELALLLDKPELRQLSQRITVRYHLQSMSSDDTAAYIDHRLGIAGWRRGHLFTPQAVRRIYQETRGNPRMINVLCDRALLIGYGEGRDQIDLQEVRRAAKEVRRQGNRRPLHLLLAGLLLLLIPLLAFGLWSSWRPASVHRTETSGGSSVRSNGVRSEIVPSLLRDSAPANEQKVVNALLALWGGEPLLATSGSLEERLSWCRDQKFEVARLSGEVEELLQLRLPLLLEMELHGQRRYLLLRGQEGGGAELSSGDGRMVTVLPVQIAPYFSKRAYLLWKNPLGLPLRNGPLQSSGELVALQTLLRAAGKEVARSGRYDAATSAAIRSFQTEQQLPADGLFGLQTLIALYRESRSYGYPRPGRGEGR